MLPNNHHAFGMLRETRETAILKRIENEDTEASFGNHLSRAKFMGYRMGLKHSRVSPGCHKIRPRAEAECD